MSKFDFKPFMGKKVTLTILKPGYDRSYTLYGYIEKFDDDWLYFRTNRGGVIFIESIIDIKVIER